MTDDGWGWWSAFEKQNEWLRNIANEIPWPDANIVPSAESSPLELAEALQRFGGIIAFLKANQGILIGRSWALKEAYENGLHSAKFFAQQQLPKGAAESAKESVALHGDFGEALREAKRSHIEMETVILSQKGLIDAYEKAWETTSRLITAVGIDADLSSSRTA